MKSFFAMFRRLVQRLIVAAQWVVVNISLVIVYYLGVGLTLLLARVLTPRILGRTRPGQASYWEDAEGYTADRELALRQS